MKINRRVTSYAPCFIIPFKLYSINGIYGWRWNLPGVSCEVEYSDEFEGWWNDLSVDEQDCVAACVGLLEEKGAQLPFPYSSGINGSKHSHMRELRIQHKGEPYRVLYAFDPRRMAILLTGGCKTGDDGWYEKFVPLADQLYDVHLEILKQEGEL